MDKNILHSVLETINAGQTINIAFNEPFCALTGDYNVLASKVGRGRGGSRVIEIQSVSNPETTFGALEVDGKQRALGTGTSEYISTMTVNGKVHGLEDPAESNRTPKPRAIRSDGTATAPVARTSKREAKASASTAIGEKVATALGDVLANNPDSVFRLTGRGVNSPLTGEWRVTSFVHENKILRMECVDNNNSERNLSFDSSVDGPNLKDAEVLFVS
jgi:hypothetical protein